MHKLIIKITRTKKIKEFILAYFNEQQDAFKTKTELNKHTNINVYYKIIASIPTLNKIKPTLPNGLKFEDRSFQEGEVKLFFVDKKTKLKIDQIVLDDTDFLSIEIAKRDTLEKNDLQKYPFFKKLGKVIEYIDSKPDIENIVFEIEKINAL